MPEPPANIEKPRLTAALEHAREAQRLLGRQHIEWLKWESTRGQARQLERAVSQVGEVVAILCNPTGDHWAAPQALQSILQTLDPILQTLDGPTGEDVRRGRCEVQRAHDALMGK